MMKPDGRVIGSAGEDIADRGGRRGNVGVLGEDLRRMKRTDEVMMDRPN